jgi:uncharacterized membrane protein
VLAVYTGSAVDALTNIIGNDDSCGLASAVAFPVTNGADYYIAVDGFYGNIGKFTIEWTNQYRPDAKIRRPTDASFTGNEIFDRSQSLLEKVRPGATARFVIELANEGQQSDVLDVFGCHSAKGYRVKYTDSTGDVTRDVVQNTYQPSLNAGQTIDLTMTIKTPTNAKGIFGCSVSARSENDWVLFDSVTGLTRPK